MSLQTRLSALITAVGADISALYEQSFLSEYFTLPSAATSLPEGMEAIFVPDSLGNKGNANVRWHLRRQTIGGTPKWVFLGGQPFLIVSGTGSNVDYSATTYGVATGTQPQFTAPAPGTYRVRFGSENFHTAAAGFLYQGVSVNGSTPVDGQDTVIISNPSGGANLQLNTARAIEVTVATAGHIIEFKYKASGATGRVRRPWMEVTPVLLSPT